MSRAKTIRTVLILLVLAVFIGVVFTPSARAGDWREGQKNIVETVLYLTRVGTRFPAYRCGIYVPGLGACYMKMTSVNMPGDPASGPGGAQPEYVADVAEILEVARRIGKADILKPGESLYMQSRFTNKVYLRVLSSDLVKRISETKDDNFLVLTKMLEEIVTYVDGELEEDRHDIWISRITEAFSRGTLPVRSIREEGMIIPGRAIVIYRKHPVIFQRQGAEGLRDELLKIYTESKGLKAYYADYRLVAGAESGIHLFMADYIVREISGIKAEDFKYREYSHKP